MGNSTAAGHVINMTGLPQAAGFHKTLGQMMYQYNIQPWDPKALLQQNLQTQIELQKTSPLRFIQVEDGLRFYGTQLGGIINVLSREKFVEMSMQLFQQRGLHLPMEEARMFYDIFDSIDLYKNAQLSLGELAGGLSSFFGGNAETKTNAVFELLAHGGSQIPKSTLQEFLKPYVWCMVPANAEVLRPVLLPHVTEEMYNDMSFGQSGYITRQELQRWSQKGQFAQGAVQQHEANMAFTIIDRAAMAISIALQVAWREYEEKFKMQEYSQQTWQQNYGQQPQQIRDVGVWRNAKQVGAMASQQAQSAQPQVQQGAGALVTGFGQAGNTLLSLGADGFAGATSWLNDAMGGRTRSDTVQSVGIVGTRRYSVNSLGPGMLVEQPVPMQQPVQMQQQVQVQQQVQMQPPPEPAQQGPIQQPVTMDLRAMQAPPAAAMQTQVPANFNIPSLAVPRAQPGMAQQPVYSARGAAPGMPAPPPVSPYPFNAGQPGLSAYQQPAMSAYQQPAMMTQPGMMAQPAYSAQQPTYMRR